MEEMYLEVIMTMSLHLSLNHKKLGFMSQSQSQNISSVMGRSRNDGLRLTLWKKYHKQILQSFTPGVVSMKMMRTWLFHELEETSSRDSPAVVFLSLESVQYFFK